MVAWAALVPAALHASAAVPPGLSSAEYIHQSLLPRGRARMLAEAEIRRELFIKYGLSSAVLQGLAAALTQLDQAVAQGTDGRRAHVGASADLDSVADEIVQVVRVMDALTRCGSLRMASCCRRGRVRRML